MLKNNITNYTNIHLRQNQEMTFHRKCYKLLAENDSSKDKNSPRDIYKIV